MVTDESSPWADGDVLRLRSIDASHSRSDVELRGGTLGGRGEIESANDGPAEGRGKSNNDSSDTEGSRLDPIELPRSTHTLLFAQPVQSLPFAFAVAILAMSFVCLGLAFADNSALFSNGPPVNVTPPVRVAQYVGVLVVLLMEEEIPTGLHLLRMIPRKSFRQKFPQTRYRRFVLSSVARILNGYYFLFNAMIVLVQATDVLDIFYNMLALQFVQQLDDIAFFLAKTDVLGKSLQRACTAECFRTEFDRRRRGKSRSLNIFLKSIYLINLCGMMGGMAYVSIRQLRGDYQPRLIDVDFGNTVWEGAFVGANVRRWMTDHPEEHEGWTLVYAYFNGVYEMNGTIGGRPRYRELRKFDRARYGKVAPAEFKYCPDINAWVFTHESISRTKSAEKSKHGCDWLLRSSETEEFNLLNVVGDWRVWVGAIGNAEVSISANQCSSTSDCNLNGQCVDGECICDSESGAQYLGTHCEVRLRDECHTIVGEYYNETYSVSSLNTMIKYFTGSTDAIAAKGEELSQVYSRPIYSYVEGNPEIDSSLQDLKSFLNFTGDVGLSFIYAGNRWSLILGLVELNNKEEALEYIEEYHGFWNRAHTTFMISDPTNSNSGTPVGVDIYSIVKEGEQYGPFGALEPLQNNTGWGYFRCGGPGSDDREFSSADRRLQIRENFLGRKRYGKLGP